MCDLFRRCPGIINAPAWILCKGLIISRTFSPSEDELQVDVWLTFGLINLNEHNVLSRLEDVNAHKGAVRSEMKFASIELRHCLVLVQCASLG